MPPLYVPLDGNKRTSLAPHPVHLWTLLLAPPSAGAAYLSRSSPLPCSLPIYSSPTSQKKTIPHPCPLFQELCVPRHHARRRTSLLPFVEQIRRPARHSVTKPSPSEISISPLVFFRQISPLVLGLFLLSFSLSRPFLLL